MLTEDVEKLFNDVNQEISRNVRELMEKLWFNWTHLGVDHKTKENNIKTLIQIEKDLHRDVINETKQKLKIMQDEIEKLKEETDELSRCLSVNIPVLDQDNMRLIDYKRELENQISGYREQVEQRRRKMERLVEWQKDLSDKLGVSMDELRDVPLPSEDDLEKLNNDLEVLQSERDKRVEIFLNTQVEIKDILEKLQEKPQTKFEYIVATSLSVDFKVTDLNMVKLAKLRQDFREKYEQTNNRVLELRERLTKLWDCLEEDHIYRQSFLQSHQGCHRQTETAIREEIDRCNQIKRQKIQVFVANVRTKIKLAWDMCFYSNEQREEFIHYYQDLFTEDTLTLHEMYLDKITQYYEEHKNIFEMVATRRELFTKMCELDARASEPGRYHNRGGQLLQEERERKAISSKLPKIEAQLRELVTAYEAKTSSTFTIDGKPLLKIIQEEHETRKADLHNKLSARKQALTPNTALFRSLATSPLGKRDRTAAGLNDKTKPCKRQLITGSATRAIGAVTSNLSAFKRSAMSTVKRRVSGRLAARALPDGQISKPRRKLDYDSSAAKTPKANGSILKHKRVSHGKRRSASNRSSMSVTSNGDTKNPLMETTLLTTYTDFKDAIIEKKISRSSLASKPAEDKQIPKIVFNVIGENDTPKKKTPITPQPMTPKTGKENQQINRLITPKKNGLITPNRLTRSGLKLNNDGFATPRAPLSATKAIQRQNTVANLQVKTTPSNMSRSKSHTHLVRSKNLPPII